MVNKDENHLKNLRFVLNCIYQIPYNRMMKTNCSTFRNPMNV